MAADNAPTPHPMVEGFDKLIRQMRQAQQRIADNVLLAGIMRKILAAEADGHVGYGKRGEHWSGPAWLTIDVRHVKLTDEEYAAVERAGQQP